MTLKRKLRILGACPEAIAWVGDRDLPTTWAEWGWEDIEAALTAQGFLPLVPIEGPAWDEEQS